MTLHKVLQLRSFLALLAVALFASALAAQDRPPSRFDVFTGYSWLHPGYSTYVPSAQENISAGYTISGTYFFNRNVGFGVDYANHRGCCCPQIYTFTAGPTVRFPTGRVTPFLHALAGLHRMDLPFPFSNDSNWGVIAGGGVDVAIVHHVSLRLFQADWEYAQHDYGPLLQPTVSGVRLSTGLVWQFGAIGAAQVFSARASCSVQPTAVSAGEPVTATASGSGFNPKRTLGYSWSGSGVKVSGNSASTQIDTTGLAPGSYTVSATVVDNGKGAHQLSATCQTAFTVNRPPMRGPSLAVSASPASVMCGDSSTITAVGNSPDNSPLTYSCTAHSGRLTGTGPTFNLDTAGVPASTIGVDCTVTDARDMTASASTSVVCSVPEQKVAVKFGSIDFKNCDQPPTRVDNAAKDELSRYAEALQADPQAKGVVVGFATASENVAVKGKKTPEFAAERAVNTKEYLAVEPVNPTKIDAERIEPRTGTGDDQRVDLWIVPAGVTFPAEGTAVVDESQVKAVPRGTYRKETRKGCKMPEEAAQ